MRLIATPACRSISISGTSIGSTAEGRQKECGNLKHCDCNGGSALGREGEGEGERKQAKQESRIRDRGFAVVLMQVHYCLGRWDPLARKKGSMP